MRLINVRRGQFVYYDNQLHKVYAVKPFFKQSVHLIRLNDLEQQLVTAREIDLYKPKHMDSFICNHKRYTLDKDKRAKVGDYILVINPRPDSLDHHYLHAIEIVSSIEDNGVISNKANGIKHNEYWIMVPGLEDGANKIDEQIVDENAPVKEEPELASPELYIPKIGDVFQKNDSDPVLQTMVIATKGHTVFLGTGLEVPVEDFTNTEKWTFIINIKDQ